MATSKNVFKKVIRFFVILFVLVCLLITSALLYLNFKKNEISKELLKEVNTLLVGEIEVESIEIKSLWTYPEIDIQFNHVQIYEHDLALRIKGETPVIKSPSLVVNANLKHLFSNQVDLKSVKIDGGTVVIERTENGEVTIGNTFLLAEMVADTLTVDSISFVLNIDDILISDIDVLLTDRSSKDTIPIHVKSIDAELTYADNKVYGRANADGTFGDVVFGEGLNLNGVPLKFDTYYGVYIEENNVVVNANSFELDDIPLVLDFNYDYALAGEMKLEIKTPPQGVRIETLFIEKDSVSKDDDPIRLLGNTHLKTTVLYKTSNMPLLDRFEAELDIHGENLTISGIDFDDFLEKYKRSQNFSLLDVGAVMFAGPAGLALTKGGDYTMLVLDSKGDSTEILQFVSEWKLKNSNFLIEDVAMSTPNNRMTTSGVYHIEGDSLDFNLYIVDKDGCALANQRIYGDATNPEMSRIKVIKTLFGPVTNLFRQIKLTKCDVVYNGKVKHPEK